MIRTLALLLLGAATPLSAAPLPRNFTVTSFDRIRVEGPYAVTLKVGGASFGRAVGDVTDLDGIDLRVEGGTLVLKQRSGTRLGVRAAGPVQISLGTPDLRSANLTGSGSLTIDRMRGLKVDLQLTGPGRLEVQMLTADNVKASVLGSGSIVLAGTAKVANLSTSGTSVIKADGLVADQVTVASEGAGELTAAARTLASVAATGPMQIRLLGDPPCELKVSGSVNVTGCGKIR